MNRLLAVPAVLCLAAGAVLGVWGWSGRDDARARIIPTVDEGPSIFGPGDEGDVSPFANAEEVASQTEAVCTLLLDAAGLRPPPTGVDPGSGIPPLSPTEEAVAIASVLDPGIVTGLPALDRASVVIAIDHQRDLIDRVLLEGRDPLVDPEVEAAGAELVAALSGRC